MKTIHNLSSIETQNKKSRFHFIVDESGSMGNCRLDVIQVLNEQFEFLRNLSSQNPNESLKAALYFFNENIKSSHVGIEVNTFPKISLEEYVPNGSTALLDAIGTVASREYKITQQAVQENLINSVFVIVTDGYENASRFFTSDQVRNLIQEMQEKGYVFVFLAAFQGGFKVAEDLNIRKENAIVFEKTVLRDQFDRVGKGFEKMIVDKKGGIDRKFFE